MLKIEKINLKKNRVSENNIIPFLKKKNKSLPSKYLYDNLGSKLFEEICNTKEYYLTRTEKEIIEKYAKNIILKTNTKEIFELGSGSAKKSKALILKILRKNKLATYYSLDISKKALMMSYDELKKISNKLNIKLLEGDFNSDLKNIQLSDVNRLYMFLGSTIGNFNDLEAIRFLRGISNIMKKKDFFLLGVDKVKNSKILNSAYNDSKGITSKFNKNILKVVNRKYKLNFKINNFLHIAKYNVKKSQIEMFLEAINKQSILLPNNENIDIKAGERILTEISRKFSKNNLKNLFTKSNFQPVGYYTDKNKYFGLYLLKPKKSL